MDNNSRDKFTLEARLKDMLWDTSDVLYQLKHTPMREESQIELQAELSAAVDPDIIIGQVSRWVDLQHTIGKDLRIYVWSSNTVVEKWLMSVVANMEHIFVTILPTYLKGEFEHDA